MRFEDPRHAAWAAVLRTQHRTVQAVQTALSAEGLPPLEWYDALLVLRFADGGRMRQSELAQRMVLDKSNISRLIQRMAARGYVTRPACADDRRGRYAQITESGRELLRRMWSVYRTVLDENFGAGLDEHAARKLTELLSRAG